MAKPIKYLVIHCTDTPAGRLVKADDIRDLHLAPKPKGRGWKQVGYRGMFHLNGVYEKLIDYNLDGIIDKWEITNGVAGINGIAAHVVYVGGNGGDTRTPAQKESMRRFVIAFIAAQPQVEIAGHYQFDNGKACPSFNVTEWLQSIGIDKKNIYNG